MLELQPLRGLGPLLFDMTPAQVRAAFPEPEMYEEWMGGNLNDSILFRGLICGFDKCDASGPLPRSKLREFRVSVARSDLSFEGRPLREWNKGTLSALPALADAQPAGAPSISIRELGLAFDFDEGGHVAFAELWRPE
jgi:hypothetical protein